MFLNPVSEGRWIGANDNTEEGVWKDILNTPLSYLNWNEGQPNGWVFENCAFMLPQITEDPVQFVPGKWDEYSCGNPLEPPFKKHAVCVK